MVCEHVSNECEFSRAWLGNQQHIVSDNFRFLYGSTKSRMFSPPAPHPQTHLLTPSTSQTWCLAPKIMKMKKTVLCLWKHKSAWGKQEWKWGGVWVGYRGVEIEVEAWWGAMWKGGGTNSASGTTEVWGGFSGEWWSQYLFDIIQHLLCVSHCAMHL